MERLFKTSGDLEFIKDKQDTLYPLGITDEAGDTTWVEADEIPTLVGVLAAAFDVKIAGEVNVTNNFSEPLSGSLNEQLIQVAINNELPVAFKYAKGNGGVLEARTLTPAKLDTVKDHKIVTGFDLDREDIRAYRLDRIKGTVSI